MKKIRLVDRPISNELYTTAINAGKPIAYRYPLASRCGQWRNNRVDKVDNVHGPPSARGPRVPDQKNLYLATQSKFDVINYSYSVSTPVDVDTAYT